MIKISNAPMALSGKSMKRFGRFRARRLLAPLSSQSHKYSRGILLIIAGSAQYPGAALLTVGGARCGGAGYIKFLDSDSRTSALVLQKYPDVVPVKRLNSEKYDALVLGPGGAMKSHGFRYEKPLVLDGQAISLINGKRVFRDQPRLTVITPHEGELPLIGYSPSQPNDLQRMKLASQIACEKNVICLLKGYHSIVAAPGLAPLMDPLGGPELATAGSGDLLAGLIGSMLASWKPDNFESAQKIVFDAVTLHSRAGKKARRRYLNVSAGDILHELERLR
jgi:hydroxyethylthiazole kinase-like uncharacterized protein yjeF